MQRSTRSLGLPCNWYGFLRFNSKMLSKLPVFALRKSQPFLSQIRCASHWNKDWRAGPYPKTEEERLAAARKYNLLPEEYEPYPDDGWGYGDYPKVAPISTINKDHWRAWTNPEDRRDFGEPVNIYELFLAEDRVEWPYTNPGIWGIPFWEQFLYFCCALGGFLGIVYVTDYFDIHHFKPHLARHMPEPGKVHYHYPKKN